MKRKLLFGLAVLIPVALFFAAREAASWKPQLIGKTRAALRAQISPDGRWATLRGGDVSEIWDLETHQRVPGRGVVGFHCFSPDSSRIAVVVNNSRPPDYRFSSPQVQLFDVASGKLVKSWRDKQHFFNDMPLHARFSSDGKRLIVLTNKMCRQFEVASGKLLSRLKIGTDKKPCMRAKISPDGALFVESFGGVTLHRVTDGAVVHTRKETEVSEELGWSLDGKIYWDRKIGSGFFRLWRVSDNAVLRKVPSQTWEIHLTPDSKHLAVATSKGLELRDVFTGKLIQTLPGPREQTFEIAPDGSFAISVDANGKIWKWRLK